MRALHIRRLSCGSEFHDWTLNGVRTHRFLVHDAQKSLRIVARAVIRRIPVTIHRNLSQ